MLARNVMLDYQARSRAVLQDMREVEAWFLHQAARIMEEVTSAPSHASSSSSAVATTAVAAAAAAAPRCAAGSLAVGSELARQLRTTVRRCFAEADTATTRWIEECTRRAPSGRPAGMLYRREVWGLSRAAGMDHLLVPAGWEAHPSAQPWRVVTLHLLLVAALLAVATSAHVRAWLGESLSASALATTCALLVPLVAYLAWRDVRIMFRTAQRWRNPHAWPRHPAVACMPHVFVDTHHGHLEAEKGAAASSAPSTTAQAASAPAATDAAATGLRARGRAAKRGQQRSGGDATNAADIPAAAPAAASAVVAAPAAAPVPPAPAEPLFDCIVVGAGLAGLSAARVLAEQGYSVRVLEARDRVGGRTMTVPTGLGEASCVDVGGQWLGPTQDAALRLAAELRLPLYRQRGTAAAEGRSVVVADGRRTEYAGTIPWLPSYIPGLPSLLGLLGLHRAISRLDAQAARVPPDAPWEAPAAAAMDARTLSSGAVAGAASAAARDVLSAGMQAILTTEPATTSWLYMLHYVRSAGNMFRLTEVEGGAQNYRVHGGMAQLSEGLARALHTAAARVPQRVAATASAPLAAAAVVLSAEVVAVEQSAETPWVVVRCRDGAVHRARWVVVAAPPPLTARIHFSPPLPSWQTTLTSRLQMGSVIKCIAFFKDAWWQRMGFNGLALDNAGPVRMVFDTCYPDAPALVAFVTGAHAIHWSDRPAAERRQAVLRHLSRLFGSDLAMQPVAFVERDWTREEFSRGCYVGVAPPGLITQVGNSLREPWGRVHFAGTEAAVVWMGYIDGAIRSGQRAGYEVVSRLRH